MLFKLRRKMTNYS